MSSDPVRPVPPRLHGAQLACRRGGRRVFKDVSIAVSAGEAVWLRGPNGCGKTSLLRILAGLARPEQGEVHRPEGDGSPAFIGHSNALKDELSVAEALGFLCSLRGAPPGRERLGTALGHFGLAGRLDATVRSLSQGQRRKVALSRLWLDEAAVWLLDEPYDALDRAGCEVLDAALAAHLQRGGALVMTSHQAATLPGIRSFDLASGSGR